MLLKTSGAILIIIITLAAVVLVTGVVFAVLSPLSLVLLQLQPGMSPVWYYGAGAVSGLVPWLGVALSTLSDVLPPHWRAPAFGLLIVGFSLGFALAPQLAFFLGHLGVSIVSLAAILVALLLLLLAFPETLPPETARQARRARQEQMQGLSAVQTVLWSVLVRPIWELSILNRNRLFRLLSALAFFSGMVSSGEYVGAGDDLCTLREES
jgi:MFS family permease